VNLAYVDTSCLVAIAFDEPGARRLASRLRRFDRLLASNLLEAELRAALVRERVEPQVEDMLSWITWIFPNRPLTEEFHRVIASGYLRGADLWHLAHALYVSPVPKEVGFLTLDARQKEIAANLGFTV
jgi:predicted nucleic acid-binding protein